MPDHKIRTIAGASFAGFYYICYQVCWEPCLPTAVINVTIRTATAIEVHRHHRWLLLPQSM